VENLVIDLMIPFFLHRRMVMSAKRVTRCIPKMERLKILPTSKTLIQLHMMAPMSTSY